MADVFEVDAQTGEVTERDFTEDELIQREIDFQAAVLADMEAESARQALAQKRAALLDRLGITEEEAQLLLGGW